MRGRGLNARLWCVEPSGRSVSMGPEARARSPVISWRRPTSPDRSQPESGFDMSSSTGLPSAVLAILGERHHVITTADLARCGVGRSAVDSLLRAGTMRRVTRGVFALSATPPTLEHRCRVLSVLHPGGFITGPTAAMLAGLRRQPRSAALHIAVPHGRRLDHERGVHYHQTTQLTRADRSSRADGIVVASGPRLAFDLAAHLRPIDHRSVVEQMLALGMVDRDQLRRIGERLVHPARRGSRTFANTIATLSDGRPQDSHDEVRLLAALVERGIPVVPQVPVTRDGKTLHLDLGVPGVRWGVELDIHPDHRTPQGHRRDTRRRRSMQWSGWQVEEVAELDVADAVTLADTADELAELYRRRLVTFSRDAS